LNKLLKEPFTLKHLIALLAIAIIVVLAYSVARCYFLYQKTLVLEARTSPFNRSVPDASFRILVLGDSTAVGTGVVRSEDSTAGRLAQKYPNAEVVNLAVNGLKIAGLETILKTIDEKRHFDIVLIQIGANDIIRLTSMRDIEAGIDRILARSREFGGKVIVLHSGDMAQPRGEGHIHKGGSHIRRFVCRSL